MPAVPVSVADMLKLCEEQKAKGRDIAHMPLVVRADRTTGKYGWTVEVAEAGFAIGGDGPFLFIIPNYKEEM